MQFAILWKCITNVLLKCIRDNEISTYYILINRIYISNELILCLNLNLIAYVGYGPFEVLIMSDTAEGKEETDFSLNWVAEDHKTIVEDFLVVSNSNIRRYTYMCVVRMKNLRYHFPTCYMSIL